MNMKRLPGPGLLLLALAACGNGGIDRAAYEAAVMEWRADRVASLKAEDGYLNLAGLYWLEPGETTFGGDAGNDIVFPGTDTPVIGRFVLGEEGVRMHPAPGVDVRYEGIPVRTLILSDDTTANPVTVTHGTLAWTAIRRDDRYGIRLRDFASPVLDSFTAPDYFPINLEARVVATLKPYAEPRTADVDTVIEGLGYHPESPGVVEFDFDGETYELEAYRSGERLFIVFGDRTNGVETYPAGRFLYALWPDEEGRTVVDFNLAYSPPCAFNDFSTCPVASARNRLPVRIEAGEKFDKRLFTPAGAAQLR